MTRILSVDVLRVSAIIAVIAIHTTPFATQSSPIGDQLDVATVINQVARFAVPFFLILSGYFWAQKCDDGGAVRKPTIAMAKRIGVLMLAWSAIYLLPTNLFDSLAYGPVGPIKEIYWNLCSAATKPFSTVMQGTKLHLWFLMALLCSLAIAALFLRYKQERMLIVLAIALYVVGLAGKAYSATPFGFHSEFNFRDGPFFSLIYFVTGYLLHRRKPSCAWFSKGLLITGLGILLHFSELRILHAVWGTSMSQDYVIGTYFYGLGIAMIALSNSKYLDFPRIAAIAPSVLGIYAAHLVFVDMLRPLDKQFAGNWIWSIVYVVVVFSLSYLLVQGMLKYSITRKIVI